MKLYLDPMPAVSRLVQLRAVVAIPLAWLAVVGAAPSAHAVDRRLALAPPEQPAVRPRSLPAASIEPAKPQLTRVVEGSRRPLVFFEGLIGAALPLESVRSSQLVPNVSPVTFDDRSDSSPQLAFGGGVGFVLSDRWSIDLRYANYKYPTSSEASPPTIASGGGSTAPGDFVTVTRSRFDTAMLGLTYSGFAPRLRTSLSVGLGRWTATQSSGQVGSSGGALIETSYRGSNFAVGARVAYDLVQWGALTIGPELGFQWSRARSKGNVFFSYSNNTSINPLHLFVAARLAL